MPIDKTARISFTLRIPIRRGRCYGLVFRESYDVDGRLDAKADVEATFVGRGGSWVWVYNGIAALTPFCPQEGGHILLAVTADKVTRGQWRGQLFSAPIAEARLREQMEQQETERRQRTVRATCGFCARATLDCYVTGQTQCSAGFLRCLGNVGLTPQDCERGDIPKPLPPKPPLKANNVRWSAEPKDAMATTEPSLRPPL